MPLSRTITRSVPDCPGLICPDVLPEHEFASGLLRAEHSLNVCGSAPLFVILKTITPRFAVLGETMKWNSDG